MKSKQSYSFIFSTLYAFIFLYLITQNHSTLFLSVYSIVLIVSIRRLWKSLHTTHSKILFLLGYVLLLSIRMIDHSTTGNPLDVIHLLFLSKKTILLFVTLSLFIGFYLFNGYNKVYPAYKDSQGLTFETVKLLQEKRKHYLDVFEENREKMNRKNIKHVVSEIPRHGYLNYTSQNNLPQTFFELAEQAIAKENNVYIILSSTGSPASEIISVFTHKEYNHVSLSFDKDLKTIISYNGGDALQHPGLNTEDINTFHQKADSQMIVYSLQATKEQRLMILGKIKTINEEGSAYNVVGLVTRVSLKPNIMFCSQFVYLMLKEVDLHYFKAAQTQVKPTDFVEKDYYRKLHFEYEIKFSEMMDHTFI